MAQVSEALHQEEARPTSPNPAQVDSLESAAQPVAGHQLKKQQAPSQAKRVPSTRLSQANRFDRNSTQRHSKTLLSYPLEVPQRDSQKQIAGIIQPSKVFTNKCRQELQALLEAIRPEYHEEIKTLYNDESLVDLHIRVGSEELKKPLHKCIIASRAFKFYCALKGFKALNPSFEKDIIVSELQAARKQELVTSQCSQSKKQSKEAIDQANELSEAAWVKRKEELLREALEIFECDLPEGLISPELLLNFVRRAYLDQDLSEEEAQLYLLICNWLKTNRPELIKSKETNKHAPNHRESFRTIQPDFEQLSLAESNTTAMSSADRSSTEPTKIETDGNEAEGTGDASQANSACDESHGLASLTRTETFEMVSRTNPDGPLVDLGDSIRDEDQTPDDDDDKDKSEFGVNTSDGSEVYTPVTRTGLKPKKFTTPVGMKTARSSKTPSSTKEAESHDDTATSSGTGAAANVANTVTRSGSINKSSTGAAFTTSPSIVTKRTITGNSDTKTSSPGLAKVRTAPSSKATPPKPKQTVIARAHPISIERSQSPGTSISKGSTKNFIAANKKLISQMERKIASPSVAGDSHNSPNAQVNEDSENENLDSDLLALTEPLTSENLAARVDKFALVSLSKLADSLSKMLIGEILTDTIVTTRDLTRQIPAHRCILAARSAYLQDQINKQCLPSLTTESPSSTRQVIKIDLSEFSYQAVYFAMMHIYSGMVRVPEDLEMEELAKLSHLLHVGTLRQVCTHHLRMNYCHYFHKPCNVCCLGVLKTLPIAWRYDLTELYSKCLTWIGSNFAHIFCLEEFSNLKPHDLIEECYKETLSQLSPDNVIQKTIECQKLLKSLPRVKWSESIICLVGRQLEDFCHYVADNYEKILQSESFLNLGKSCWECEVLEENLLAAMNHLKPDAGCKTLIQLDKIECSIETYCEEPKSVSETFANLISKMRKYCERYLLKEATSVVHCSSWRQMNPSLQKRIKDQALLSTDFDEPTRHLAAKPKLPSMARHQQQSSSLSRSSPSPQPYNASSDTKSPSNRSTPDSKIRSPNTTYLPPPKTKPAVSRHVKVLK